MTDMVERVAKAITEAFEREGRVFDDGQAETLARAAIEAMREPTEAMTKAGDLPGWDDSVSVGLSGEVWNAMIDAALAPPRSRRYTVRVLP